MLASESDQLLKIYSGLPAEQANTLFEFALFLATKTHTEPPKTKPVVSEPLGIPRPDKESIIGAIKRLKKNYPMLDSDKLMNDTQNILTQHLLKGKALLECVEEVEQIFLSHYEKWLIDHANIN